MENVLSGRKYGRMCEEFLLSYYSWTSIRLDLDIFVFDIQIENVPNASVVRGKIKEKKAWTMTRISLRNLKKLLNREVGG